MDEGEVKALTLTQPYASLVAHGWKKNETRSWRTNHRGPLAIHAASTLNGVGGLDACVAIIDGLDEALFARLSWQYGRTAAEIITKMPFGAFVAVTFVEDCIPVEDARALEESLVEHGLFTWEVEVGDYTPGRWAWVLREPVAVHPPIPARGAQGLWNVPDEVLPESARKAILHAV